MTETFKSILRFSSARRKNLLTAFIASFLRSAFGITQLLAIVTAIDVLSGNGDIKSSLIKVTALAIICIAGNFITSYIEQSNTLTVGFYMVADKRLSVGNLLRNIPLGFFNRRSAGNITATLTTTLSGVETAATMVMVGIVSGILNSLLLFLFMLFYDTGTGLLTGAGMIAYLIIVNYQMRLSAENAPALQKAQTDLSDAALVFLKGIKVTKAFSFKNGDRNLKEAIENSCRENMRLTKKSMPSQLLAGICIAVSESLILVLSLYNCYKADCFDITRIIVLLIFSFMAYSSLNSAGSMLSMIGLLSSGLKEVGEIESLEQTEVYEPVMEPVSDEIELKHVSFSYDGNEVLHDVSTVIKENSLTAIIGPSGSGKTTLCQLIPRFRDVCSGCITIGGADVRNIESRELMARISMVFQNVYLFEDTIFNNIRFGRPDASYEEVIEAAVKAKCDTFINGLPDGYDTLIEEGGSSLSGGEKQRISIARAILKDSPVIILDEATSALDTENENEILSAIDELIKGKTVIMIAHRIRTVEKADHIIALKDGRISEEGTHDELKDNNGLYSDFLKARDMALSWRL